MTDRFPISKLLAVELRTFVIVGLRQKVQARKMLDKDTIQKDYAGDRSQTLPDYQGRDAGAPKGTQRESF